MCSPSVRQLWRNMSADSDLYAMFYISPHFAFYWLKKYQYFRECAFTKNNQEQHKQDYEDCWTFLLLKSLLNVYLVIVCIFAFIWVFYLIFVAPNRFFHSILSQYHTSCWILIRIDGSFPQCDSSFHISPMFLHVSPCSSKFLDVSPCSSIFLNVPPCSLMFLHVPPCSPKWV